jgi:hypothetical protein
LEYPFLRKIETMPTKIIRNLLFDDDGDDVDDVDVDEVS